MGEPRGLEAKVLGGPVACHLHRCSRPVPGEGGDRVPDGWKALQRLRRMQMSPPHLSSAPMAGLAGEGAAVADGPQKGKLSAGAQEQGRRTWVCQTCVPFRLTT